MKPDPKLPEIGQATIQEIEAATAEQAARNTLAEAQNEGKRLSYQGKIVGLEVYLDLFAKFPWLRTGLGGLLWGLGPLAADFIGSLFA